MLTSFENVFEAHDAVPLLMGFNGICEGQDIYFPSCSGAMMNRNVDYHDVESNVT
jgi:hypothetical protein